MNIFLKIKYILKKIIRRTLYIICVFKNNYKSLFVFMTVLAQSFFCRFTLLFKNKNNYKNF